MTPAKISKNHSTADNHNHIAKDNTLLLQYFKFRLFPNLVRVRLLSALCMLLWFCGIQMAQAVPVTAFGPTTFVRTSGAPVVETHNWYDLL